VIVSEYSHLNTVFRVGLHSVHKRVFRQSWFQSTKQRRRRSVEMQALPPRTGNRRDTLREALASDVTWSNMSTGK